jgi:hypothetical protein
MSQWDVVKKLENESGKDVNISKESFSASLFLASVHRHTTTDDFTAGRVTLVKSQKRIESKMADLIQNNLSKFIEAKDAVDKIHKQKDSMFKDNSLQNLDMQYKVVQDRSKDLFDPLIKRKKESEDIKDAIQYLKKYGFLFNIPTNIEVNIAKKEYKKVVHDYNKAKFFKQRCTDDLVVFQPIFESVNSQITRLKQILFDQLILKDKDDDNLRLLTEDEERVIGYLNSFDCDNDPAWFYLNEMHLYVKNLMNTKLDEHLESLNEIHSLRIQMTNMERKWKQQIGMVGHQQEELNNEQTHVSSDEQQSLNYCTKQEKESETLKLIQNLCSVMKFILPDLWKLCNNILTGKYQKRAQRLVPLKADNAQTEAKVESIFKDIFDSFATKVNDALDKIDDGSAHQKIYCKCVEKVIECYETLIPAIPSRYIIELQEYSDLKRRLTINEIWRRTNHEISHFYEMEDWKTLSASQSITALPMKFQEHVFKTVTLLKPFVRVRDNLLEEVQEHLLEGALVFADCLHQLAFRKIPASKQQTSTKRMRRSEIVGAEKQMQVQKENELLMILSNIYHTRTIVIPDIVFAFIAAFQSAKAAKKDDSKSQTEQAVDKEVEKKNDKSESSESKSDASDSEDDESESSASSSSSSSSDSDEDEDSGYYFREEEVVVEKENQSAVTLAEREILKLATQFQNKDEFKAVMQIYDNLSDFVVDAFVRRKSQMFTHFVEKGLLLSGYNWSESPEPMEVQSFILEILLELSITHSRVERVTATSIMIDSTSHVADPVSPSSPASKNQQQQQLPESDDSSFTRKIFTKLSERLAEVFTEYIKSLEEISSYGALQLDINMSFVRKTLKNFETKKTKTLHVNLVKYMENNGYEKKSDKNKLKDSILTSTAQQTHIQLDCFDLSSKDLVKHSGEKTSGIGLRQRSLGLLKMAL